jgi:hypothetical protein
MDPKDQAARGGTENPTGPPVRPKPYSSPVITDYGSIAKLTRSGGQTQLEGASGRNRME